MDPAAIGASVIILVIGVGLTLVTKLILGRFDGIEKRLDLLNGHLADKVSREDFKEESEDIKGEMKELWKHGHKGLNGNDARVTRGS